MYCKYCGAEIVDGAYICTKCGRLVNEAALKKDTEECDKKKENTIAIVGFVLSFFVAIAGLICSIIGYTRAKKDNLPHKGLALAGIIVSAVSMGLSVIYLITMLIWMPYIIQAIVKCIIWFFLALFGAA